MVFIMVCLSFLVFLKFWLKILEFLPNLNIFCWLLCFLPSREEIKYLVFILIIHFNWRKYKYLVTAGLTTYYTLLSSYFYPFPVPCSWNYMGYAFSDQPSWFRNLSKAGYYFKSICTIVYPFAYWITLGCLQFWQLWKNSTSSVLADFI